MFAMSATVLAGNVTAQASYPEKPVRLVVGLPPGSSADIVARLLGQRLTESLEKPVVVENAPGAAGNIALERVVKAAPDGHTLAVAGITQITVNPSLYKLAFDPMKALVPITQLTESPMVLVVNSAIPAKSTSDLVALAKVKRGELTFASGAIGILLTTELLKSMTGIEIREIPYRKGVVDAIPDLLAGRITMMFSPVPAVLRLVQDGKLRALGVTSLKRSAALPDVPTIDESGFPGFHSTSWYGLFAPDRTPATIIRRLHLETVNALARADVRTKLADQGFEVIGNSPDEFAAVIKSEFPKWAKLIKESGLKAD
jgi:tripartite-type tricarboxylate transporter receptor subunit TctC